LIENTTIPGSMKLKLDALVDAGYYSSESDAIKSAIMALFESKRELNVVSAIELYKKEKASLARAAEIAGMNLIEFNKLLVWKGFIREIEARSTVEMDKKLRKYLNE